MVGKEDPEDYRTLEEAMMETKNLLRQKKLLHNFPRSLLLCEQEKFASYLASTPSQETTHIIYIALACWDISQKQEERIPKCKT